MTKNTPLRKKPIISASEIGQYTFCSLSWYLQKCGYPPQSHRLLSGKQAHIRLGRTLDVIQEQHMFAKKILLVGWLCFIVASFILLFEVLL
jgi:hypothetical protein